MARSLLEYLRLAEPHLPSSLLSRAALAELEPIASQLPSVSACGFECRLGEPAPLADFGVRLLAADGSRAVLAGREDAGFQLPQSLLQHPVWQRLRRFSARWEEAGSLLHREVESIFLEFDTAGGAQEVLIPSFFIEFDRQARHRLAALEEALALLWGEPLPAAIRARMVACLEALPAEGRVTAVGAMFSRRFPGVRLCLNGLGPDTLPDYLARIGWPGEPAALQALLHGVAERVGRMSLGLDVAEAVLPRVGVECHLAEGVEADKERWSLLLERLVELKLCLPAKSEALRQWIGHTHTRARHEAMPESLRPIAQALGPEAIAAFLRRINHIKLVHQPGRAPEAKAYLTFIQAWVLYDAASRAYVLGDTRQALAAAARG